MLRKQSEANLENSISKIRNNVDDFGKEFVHLKERIIAEMSNMKEIKE